jgi:flap endonuclease-1
MGIRNLNKYFRQNCKKKSIQKKHISYLRNKTIVIDTSIYLYKFRSQNALEKNFRLMVQLFQNYNIIPIFVFDGKPPLEKMDELRKRKCIKDEAERKYILLQEQLETNNDEDKVALMKEMEKLKSQFIKISEKDVRLVKSILDEAKISYINAKGEADKECASIMIKNHCFGCMSDDMDMFVYGCNNIIRHLSILNETILIYSLNEILKDINLNFNIFKQICILSGTDYNTYDNISLTETIRWYNEYKKLSVPQDDEYCFYNWLWKNTKYIRNYESLIHIHSLFNIENL